MVAITTSPLLLLLVAAGLTAKVAGQAAPIFFPDTNPLRMFSQCADHGRPGVCLLLQECPQARVAYATHDARTPTRCGFEGITPIVCCTDGVPDLRKPETTTHKTLPLVDTSGYDVAFLFDIRSSKTTTQRSLPVVDTAPHDVTSLPDLPKPETTTHKNLQLVGISPPDVSFRCGVRTRGAALTETNRELGKESNFKEASNGFQPERNSWPWVALLGWLQADGSVKWRCDGSLISPRYVLTAAHCLDEGPPQLVRLGEHDSNSDTDGAPHEDYDLFYYYIYPDYSPPAAYHDLALLELDTVVQLGDHKPEIVPICLPWGQESTANLVGRFLSFVGWVATQFDGELTSVLQEKGVTGFESSVCHTNYSELPLFPRKFPRGITAQDFVCAGNIPGGMDACEGDSGGSLAYDVAGIGYVLSGISNGYGCRSPDYPGLYTRIHTEEYLRWIKTIAFSPSELLT